MKEKKMNKHENDSKDMTAEMQKMMDKQMKQMSEMPKKKK